MQAFSGQGWGVTDAVGDSSNHDAWKDLFMRIVRGAHRKWPRQAAGWIAPTNEVSGLPCAGVVLMLHPLSIAMFQLGASIFHGWPRGVIVVSWALGAVRLGANLAAPLTFAESGQLPGRLLCPRQSASGFLWVTARLALIGVIVVSQLPPQIDPQDAIPPSDEVLSVRQRHACDDRGGDPGPARTLPRGNRKTAVIYTIVTKPTTAAGKLSWEKVGGASPAHLRRDSADHGASSPMPYLSRPGVVGRMAALNREAGGDAPRDSPARPNLTYYKQRSGSSAQRGLAGPSDLQIYKPGPQRQHPVGFAGAEGEYFVVPFQAR